MATSPTYSSIAQSLYVPCGSAYTTVTAVAVSGVGPSPQHAAQPRKTIARFISELERRPHAAEYREVGARCALAVDVRLVTDERDGCIDVPTDLPALEARLRVVVHADSESAHDRCHDIGLLCRHRRSVVSLPVDEAEAETGRHADVRIDLSARQDMDEELQAGHEGIAAQELVARPEVERRGRRRARHV